jgi:hypothetical protein
MPQYPIQIPRDTYHGVNVARRRRVTDHNRVAARLEEHINRVVGSSHENRHVFVYGFLAADVGIAEADVREALAGLGGETGITVWKGSVGA